ncbi:hypothetical protein ES288_A06G121500v1 [Gossypium darwinii]|uniref:Uncharacterized protein n=1 Tax=Gossypium darwinii TaxID=34276 RepID=A0A5D2G7V3_GOSDA|nr:hypothetical protein ES288_A06G121500v1 [Gossypium darwinii]
MVGLWFGKARYFWLAWSSLVLTLKACWLNRMNKFTVLRDLNFVAEKIRINGLVLSFSKVLLWYNNLPITDDV